jgi:hypothetical protein
VEIPPVDPNEILVIASLVVRTKVYNIETTLWRVKLIFYSFPPFLPIDPRIYAGFRAII